MVIGAPSGRDGLRDAQDPDRARASARLMSPVPLVHRDPRLWVEFTTFPHRTAQADTFKAGLLPWPG